MHSNSPAKNIIFQIAQNAQDIPTFRRIILLKRSCNPKSREGGLLRILPEIGLQVNLFSKPNEAAGFPADIEEFKPASIGRSDPLDA